MKLSATLVALRPAYPVFAMEGVRLFTGWYGVPGSERGTKVHIHVGAPHRRPLCGVRLHHDSEFQWCSMSVHVSYLECERCKAALDRAAKEAG